MTSPAPIEEVLAPSAEAPPRIECAEVWGGNDTIHIPVELPGMRGVLFSRSCSGGQGGDLYYLSICGSGLLSRVCVADVVGHGERVADVGREIHELMRRSANWPDHRRMLAALNELLYARGLDAFTTATALTYYPPSRRLSISYAGHPPAWIGREGGKRWERLRLAPTPDEDDHGGMIDCALAIESGARFSRRRLRMSTGDRILIVTDGVLETRDVDGAIFGDAGVERVIDANGGAAIEALSDAMRAALETHAADGSLDHDDVTFLVLEVAPAPPGPALWHVIRNRLLRRRRVQ